MKIFEFEKDSNSYENVERIGEIENRCNSFGKHCDSYEIGLKLLHLFFQKFLK